MSSDIAFTGSVPQVYQDVLVPYMFAPYAQDLAARVAAESPGRVLEIAAGTGVVTAALREILPDAGIVATDLNEAMLAVARANHEIEGVEWQQADAQDLPFEAESFDAVACQFGIMFFPDPAKAIAEMNRVLRPGGVVAIYVWGSLDKNPAAKVVEEVAGQLFPDDPPLFIGRTPHGHGDPEPYLALLRAAGFAEATAEWVAKTGRSPSAERLAEGFCLGTPLVGELEARRAGSARESVRALAEAFTARWGNGPIEVPIEAYALPARKP